MKTAKTIPAEKVTVTKIKKSVPIKNTQERIYMILQKVKVEANVLPRRFNPTIGSDQISLNFR